MWIKTKPEHKITEMCDFGGGPAINHSVICWLCDKDSAVYSAYPEFIFLPCWDCQKTHNGHWNKKKWYQKIFK